MAFLKKTKDPFKEIQACLQRRDYKGALPWFAPLLEKESKNTQIRLRYADTLVLAGSKKEAVRQYKTVADELAEAGFMIRAIAINKKIVQLDPTQVDIHEKLATMNEQRRIPSSRSLPLEMPFPGVPRADEAAHVSPVVGAPSQGFRETSREPSLSLEDSIEMEFGTGRTSAAEPPPSPRPLSVPSSGVPDVVEEEQVVELDLGGLEGAGEEPAEGPQPAPAVGFEVLDETRSASISAAAPAAEAKTEWEGAGPSFEAGGERPSFAEEQVSFSDETAEVPQEEAELELELEPEEPETFEKPQEARFEPIEEPDLQLDIETEPSMAADGDNPLVGLLGEDIDALIDSIIDDVGSTASGAGPVTMGAASRIPLFSDLTVAEFVDVAVVLIRRSEKAGKVIVREGEAGDSMFIISTGEVQATRETAGKRVILATLRDGDFFGEMAVLSGEPRSATVTAVKNTELLELSRKDLQKICSRHPDVEAKVRLAYEERRMTAQARKDV